MGPMSEGSVQERGLRVAVSGARGNMGTHVCAAVDGDGGLELTVLVDPGYGDDGMDERWRVPSYTDLSRALSAEEVDVVIDFTVPSVVRENVLTCLEQGKPAVVGTTGLTEEGLAEIRKKSESGGTPVLIAPNFALGAVLMMEFAQQAARHYGDAEIIELHHPGKLDAPSGTARRTAGLMADVWEGGSEAHEAPAVHSVRLPGLVAHQEVIFGGRDETLTIRHDSLSRESFMPGVVLAAKRVSDLQGLTVGLENIL